MSDPIKDFDLDDPKLPDSIKSAALTSGGFPYGERLKNDAFEEQLYDLQVQLVALQAHMLDKGGRVLIVFEGRDAAGKSSTINAYREHLNPRSTISVALPKPSAREGTQWYFQRFVGFFPAAGETVMFDRSWYNRSGVELVMGFTTEPEADAFLAEAPRFERMLVDDGIHLFKFWLEIGREMQIKRFWERRQDPLKQWKLSPIDLKALALWDEYTSAAERTLTATDTPQAPWTVIRANDERRARLNTIRAVLSRIEYKGKNETQIGDIDPDIVVGVDEFLTKSRGGRR